jgi:hypothetical protein
LPAEDNTYPILQVPAGTSIRSSCHETPIHPEARLNFTSNKMNGGTSLLDTHYSSRFHGQVPQHHFTVISPSFDEQSNVLLGE